MPTRKEWLEYAKANKDILITFIKSWHPEQSGKEGGLAVTVLPITAPRTEEVCEAVRKQIREEAKGDPVERFVGALETDNVGTIYVVLNQAWFGVPESTGCWRIEGFKQAVHLLDTVPEGEGDD